ncbi:MAG: hypothetical protein ACP5GI_05415 [Sulfolobales archaeon]
MKRADLIYIIMVLLIVLIAAYALIYKLSYMENSPTNISQITAERYSSSGVTTSTSGSNILSSPSNSIPNGIYEWSWEEKGFVRLETNSSGPYIPKRDGYYLYYFHNNKCPHCIAFEPKLVNYLKNPDAINYFKNKLTIVLVACSWFTYECSDPTAQKTFRLFNVMSSPTLLLIKISNGSIVNVIDITQIYVDLINKGLIPNTGEIEPQYVFQVIKANI